MILSLLLRQWLRANTELNAEFTLDKEVVCITVWNGEKTKIIKQLRVTPELQTLLVSRLSDLVPRLEVK